MDKEIPDEPAAEAPEIKPTESTAEASEVKPVEPAAKAPEETQVDLSALQGFDFGTNWSESKPSSGSGRSFDRGPGRRERRPRGQQPDRKDRRPFNPGSFHKSGRRDGGEHGDRDSRSSGPGRRQTGRPDIPRKVVEVSFYPEDHGFKALCKALRTSTITYELFDIARIILEKEERFYLMVHPVETSREGEASEESLFVVESDGLPFLREDSAKQHALSDCLEHFFISETKEVEPPSGSFSSIQKCGFTGELLGPPNYHRLKKILADHHASRLSNMPYAKFESRIESIKEEEVIAEWLEKMKTQTTYTLKPEFGEPRVFEDGETARAFVKANLSDKMVRSLKSVRLEGPQLSKVMDPLLKANLDFAWERQKRFPLDTANLLRGRLRRQKFALYKKGSKGVSFVCAVKRKFRKSDEAFSEPVQKLLEFLEANPNIKVKDLSEQYLGFSTHAVEGEPPPELTEEQQRRLKAMTLDFQWLLKEGYIAEYSDGSIYAHPADGAAQGGGEAKPADPVSQSHKSKSKPSVKDDQPVSKNESAGIEKEKTYETGVELKSEKKPVEETGEGITAGIEEPEESMADKVSEDADSVVEEPVGELESVAVDKAANDSGESNTESAEMESEIGSVAEKAEIEEKRETTKDTKTADVDPDPELKESPRVK